MSKRKIKVVFACGAGVAQCTAMEIPLKKFFKEKGWALETKKGNYGEAPGTFRSWKPDIYITTGGTGVSVRSSYMARYPSEDFCQPPSCQINTTRASFICMTLNVMLSATR